MTRQYRPAILLIFSILLFTACTRNNGNIGKQFGQWKVTDITKNGEPVTDYSGNMFWSFQNTTIEMKYLEDNHTYLDTFGNYRIMDETLFITFPDENRPPLPGLGLKAGVENEIQIVKLTGSEMVLAYTVSAENVNEGVGANMILHLKKW